ncbi:manganese dependent peroxidase 1 [Mycena leptocephala]|nr:manganese dependent peroxidase 1 [Mycena leptocephala]
MFLKYLSTALVCIATIHSSYGAPQRRATCAGGQTVKNAACCAWFPVLEDILPNLFDNECGPCCFASNFPRRIGFSPTKGGGGADGSICFNATELTYPGNDGLDDAVRKLLSLRPTTPVTPGDFIQFAAAVSLSLCPGAPKVAFMMGRPMPTAPAPGPDGLVPEPFGKHVNVILARMADAGGFTPTDVVALLASHSVAGADTVDPTIPGTPFDSTPSLFDTQIFIEVQLRGTAFPGLPAIPQRIVPGNLSPLAMQTAFTKAFNKLAILGHNAANLIDCSDVIPAAPPLPANSAPPTRRAEDGQHRAGATAPFPTFTAQPGPATTVPAIPQ